MNEETPYRPDAVCWMSNRMLQLAFLSFFVLFLVVGAALTLLGFLDYGGQGGAMGRAFRVLGVVALLLCIGFLIAACVVVSECITSSIKHGGMRVDPDECDDMYDYQLMCRTSNESITRSTNIDYDRNTPITASASAYSTVIPNSRIVSNEDQLNGRNDTLAAPLGLCPSCSCQLIPRPIAIRSNPLPQSMSYPNGIVQSQSARETAVIHSSNEETLGMQMLQPIKKPLRALDSSMESENDELADTYPKEWV